jgi:hypothetical protein
MLVRPLYWMELQCNQVGSSFCAGDPVFQGGEGVRAVRQHDSFSLSPSSFR